MLKKYRYSLILLRQLVITEFKLRYQGSALGYLWSLLRPLFLFVILYFVFVYFLKIGGDIPHWPVAMLLGIVVWNFFSEVTNTGVTAVVDKGDVIRKINFPKIVIVLASSVSALINLVINMLIIGVFMYISGVQLSGLILLAPLIIIEVFLFSLGMALLLSTLFVRLRDINYIWEIIMQGLFYASIVIYPASLVVEMNNTVATIMLLNPVAQAIQDLRYTVVSQDMPTLYGVAQSEWIWFMPFAIVALVCCVGFWYFKKRSRYFAEEV